MGKHNPPLWSGPIVAVELQRDPVRRKCWAVYTRHADTRDFYPAQFRTSHRLKTVAYIVARVIAWNYRVQLEDTKC